MHDVTQAWTGIGASVHVLWQQIRMPSSIQSMLAVVIYLACISALYIASTTIMQFTAFNSTSSISIQSEVAWPNSTVLAHSFWISQFQSIPPSGLLANIQTNGLLNNTIYDILSTSDSSFTSAIVNATSIQSNCSLLSNLTFFNSNESTLNFSVDGFGSGGYSFDCEFFEE